MAVGFFVKALPATELAPRMARLAAAVFENEQVNVDVGTTVGFTLRIQNTSAQTMPDHAALKQFLAMFEKHAGVLAPSAAIRHAQQNGVHVNYSTSDGLIGKFDIALNDAGRARRALDALSEHFTVIDYFDHVRARMTEAEDAALQMRERSVADLRDEVGKLATFLAELGQREAESRRKAQEQLDREYRERQAKLDDAHREREEAAATRERERDEAFIKRVAEFEERVNKFKTQEAKFMRRELLERIDGVIGAMKTFTLSRATQEKRHIIHVFTWLLLLTSSGVVVTMLATLLRSNPPDLRLLFPLGAASATLVTTFVYYLKWNDRWFREHADNEFAAKQYQADILRASWVAELVSEWQAEKEDADLPPELLNAFTRHLFRDSGGARENEHPLEALSGMVKRVNAITVGKGTISVRGDAHEAPSRSKRDRRAERGDDHDDAPA